MIDPTIWMEASDKREYFETLAKEAEEAEVIDDNTKNT